MVDIIRAFFQQASAQGSRSTVMNPLGWLIAMILAALAYTSRAGPSWLLVALVVLAFICSFVYLCAYAYFAYKDHDTLRSERFSLSKMAIERGLVGDNIHGLVEALDQMQQPQLDRLTHDREDNDA